MTGQRRKQAQMGEHSRMNRTEFMRQLESLLQNISATEREEALQYYNEYFILIYANVGSISSTFLLSWTEERY